MGIDTEYMRITQQDIHTESQTREGAAHGNMVMLSNGEGPRGPNIGGTTVSNREFGNSRPYQQPDTP